MRARRARLSQDQVKPTLRWAGPLLAVIGVLVLCGFTLYWTQSKLDAVSTRLDSLERGVKAAVGRSSAQAVQRGSASASTKPAGTQPSSAGPVRLGRIVKCRTSGNMVAVTYDPAQLFSGEDAVRLAALNGEAVTGDTYVFDPTKDVFVGAAPVNAAVTIHRAPAGWTGRSPKTIAQLATDLQAAGGQPWLTVYFWLHFNRDYIVGIEQYQVPAAP